MGCRGRREPWPALLGLFDILPEEPCTGREGPSRGQQAAEAGAGAGGKTVLHAAVLAPPRRPLHNNETP